MVSPLQPRSIFSSPLVIGKVEFPDSLSLYRAAEENFELLSHLPLIAEESKEINDHWNIYSSPEKVLFCNRVFTRLLDLQDLRTTKVQSVIDKQWYEIF